MASWLLIFAGGLLGSAHCVGMCGGFVLALGGTRPGLAANLRRQIAYGTGRIFTYTAGGAAAGFGGWRLAAETQALVNMQAVLSIVAGLLLVALGLAEAGVLSWPRRGGASCLGTGMFGSLLRATRLRSVFLGGMVNGLLPCGLVYAYLALAASSGSLLLGSATMLCFGLGTLPLMVATGCGGTLLTCGRRRQVLRLAAWCVVLTGALTLGRGIAFLRPVEDSPSCPMCRESGEVP
jgi:sulfite exporter TauE/SafE